MTKLQCEATTIKGTRCSARAVYPPSAPVVCKFHSKPLELEHAKQEGFSQGSEGVTQLNTKYVELGAKLVQLQAENTLLKASSAPSQDIESSKTV